MQALRDYRLVKELGLSPAVIDETPAHRLDWLLLVHDQVEAVAREKAEEQRARSR